MIEVENFIYKHEGDQREILLYLHHLFIDFDLSTKIRYKIPFYYGKTWICYLNPIKKGGIELVFIRGNELSNSQGLLDNKGRKQVAGLEIFNVKDIPQETLREVIHEAILLDEMVPYASKRKK